MKSLNTEDVSFKMSAPSVKIHPKLEQQESVATTSREPALPSPNSSSVKGTKCHCFKTNPECTVRGRTAASDFASCSLPASF